MSEFEEGAFIGGLLESLPSTGDDLDTSRRLLMLGAIAKGTVTRSQIASQLELRPATVSRHISELIDVGLIRESQAILTNSRGRPGTTLACKADEIVCIVIRIVSDTFVGALVDLFGRIKVEITRTVNAATIDADGIETLLSEMTLSLQRSAGMSQVAGLSLSLPGIVQGDEKRWYFSGRFPSVDSVVLSRLEGRIGMKVRVYRPLNAELRARLLSHPIEREGIVMLLHWGFGISISMAKDGHILSGHDSAFGEIGHWNVAPNSSVQCRCGKTGCLETLAALWALRDSLGLEDVSEEKLGLGLHRNESLASHSVIENATDAVARAIQYAYLMMFPRRIVVTGPFVQSTTTMRRLERMFRSYVPEHLPEMVELIPARHSAADETVGAAKPLLHERLHDLVSNPRRLGNL